MGRGCRSSIARGACACALCAAQTWAHESTKDKIVLRRPAVTPALNHSQESDASVPLSVGVCVRVRAVLTSK